MLLFIVAGLNIETLQQLQEQRHKQNIITLLKTSKNIIKHMKHLLENKLRSWNTDPLGIRAFEHRSMGTRHFRIGFHRVKMIQVCHSPKGPRDDSHILPRLQVTGQ